MGQPWADHVTGGQITFIVGFPILWVFLIYIFLNYVLDLILGTKPKTNEYTKLQVEQAEMESGMQTSTYGTTGSSQTVPTPRQLISPVFRDASPEYPDSSTVRSENDIDSPMIASCNCLQPTCGTCNDTVLEAGAVAGDYEAEWTKTFDFVFLVLMAAVAVVLIIVTVILHPEYFSEPEFWGHELLKFFTMVAVSLLGGIVCRWFCKVDEKGYIITNKGSWFKVNYTRKLQHFAAYMIPLVLKSKFHNTLSLAWGDFFTLLAFFVLIKPLREASTLIMLQFNALDRPEDRPHTLDWIVLGNLAPGFVIIILFKWLFAIDGNASLVTIIVYITGIGDGLAEPVGIYFGKHKYSAMSCVEGRSYTRSWEGSACVFMSGMFFPAIQYASFDNFNQVAAAMVLLPPIMTYLEATAPHTMDSPVLMTGAGAVLLVVLYAW